MLPFVYCFLPPDTVPFLCLAAEIHCIFGAPDRTVVHPYYDIATELHTVAKTLVMNTDSKSGKDLLGSCKTKLFEERVPGPTKPSFNQSHDPREY